MNVVETNRSNLLAHLRATGEHFHLKFLGMLPRGTAGHVSGDDAVELLAEKQADISLLDLAGAEIDLSERLGRPVAIVLDSGLRGDYGNRVRASVRPL
jgi:predicted nucleotidyltransferase